MKQINRPKSLFSSVKPRKIPDTVYKQVVSLIATGQLKPGERLPSERDMAFELGVSRQSIREAIHRAKTEGLLEVRQGGGTFVISSLKGNLKPPLMILLEEQAEKIFEFLEIRRVLEGWCAERAAETAKSVDLKRMLGTLKRLEKVKPSDPAWEEMDLRFHASIVAATHNVIAMHIMEGLKDSFHSYFRLKKFTTKPERKDVLLKQHTDIYEAIKGKKSREAKKKILKHLDYVEEMIKEDFTRRK